jgi:citrate synthase
MGNLGNWGGLPRYLSAREAAARLGVSRRTLYVYVSRHLVSSVGEPHNKQYSEADIEQLLGRKKAARRATVAARGALDWGLPVLDSSITCIKDDRIFYRGVDVVDLARAASIEDTARLLWGCGPYDPFAEDEPAPASRARVDRNSPPMRRCAEMLASAAECASGTDVEGERREAARLTRRFYAAIAGAAPSVQPLHRLLAHGFGRARHADLFRRAAILCADHELSASAFTVRCAASTGAPLAGALLAGLGAFHGPAQGGAPEEVEKLVDECNATGIARTIARRLADEESFPGFGHLLHPLGDCRSRALLDALRQSPETEALQVGLRRELGLEPNIAFALVALRRSLDLPRSTAIAIYASGRVLGWCAHAIEQHASGGLIRPRARYVGPPPGSAGATGDSA